MKTETMEWSGSAGIRFEYIWNLVFWQIVIEWQCIVEKQMGGSVWYSKF